MNFRATNEDNNFILSFKGDVHRRPKISDFPENPDPMNALYP